MKKIFTFLIAFFSITSIFAQSRNWNNGSNDRHQSSDSYSYGQSTNNNHRTGGYDNRNNGYDNHNSGYDNRNSGYDNRNSGYDNHSYGQPAYNSHDNDRRWDNDRNDRYYDNDRHEAYGHHSVNTYDVRRSGPVYRDNRYYGREPQRTNNTIKAVGAGLIVGGIIALMAGSH